MPYLLFAITIILVPWFYFGAGVGVAILTFGMIDSGGTMFDSMGTFKLFTWYALALYTFVAPISVVRTLENKNKHPQDAVRILTRALLFSFLIIFLWIKMLR